MPELEWKTRRDRIDTRLRALGWEISPFAPGLTTSGLNHHAITEFETANGPADYALVVDGQVLGIVEAKKLSLGPQNVLTQAERYARGLNGSPFDFDGRKAPFLWSIKHAFLYVCTIQRLAMNLVRP